MAVVRHCTLYYVCMGPVLFTRVDNVVVDIIINTF